MTLSRISLIRTLHEHHGSVNRLSWSEDGSLLASCSDDLHVAVFRPERNRYQASFLTTHTNNILGVKFLPMSGGLRLVSGGADGVVEVHELSDSGSERIFVEQLFCHKSRVKYVETEFQNPNLFFSAGEDGFIRQYDVRLAKSGCKVQRCKSADDRGSMYGSRNCLVNSKVHVMSVRLCQTDPNMMVASFGDNRIRQYDRRMLSQLHPDSSSCGKPVKEYCPSHLLSSRRSRSTYAEFSPCGKSIVATYHRDHTYTFCVEEKDDMNSITTNFSPAPLPWRQPILDFHASRSESEEAQKLALKECIKLASTNIIAGTRLVDVHMPVLGYSLFSRSNEICGSILGHLADEEEKRAVVEVIVRSLEMRASVVSVAS